MKTPIGTFVLGLAFQTLLVSADSSNVLSLDSSNFDEGIESNPLVLVNFCASGASACIELEKEFTEAARLLEGESPRFATIDCLKDVDLCAKYDVVSYPAIRVFEGPDKMSRYRDLRKAHFIASHAIKKTTPNIWTLQTGPETKEFVKLNAITVILRASPKDEKAIEEFTKFAASLKDSLTFAIEFDSKLPRKGLVGPDIKLYKSFGWEKIPFLGGTISKTQLTRFIQEMWKPSMPDCNQENYPTYMEAGKPLAYLFANTRPEREYYRRTLNHLSSKFYTLIDFVIMDSWEWLGHAEEMGLKSFPGFVIHDTPSRRNFVFDSEKNEVGVEEIDKFVQGYVKQMREESAKKPTHVEL